jgi:hypothetical protein
LSAFGAERPFIVASGVGTGPLPADDQADWLVLDPPSGNIITELRFSEAVISDPPQAVIEALDRYDPRREAWVLPQLALAVRSPTMAGRRIFGPRFAAALHLDDKTVVDSFWDRAGIDHAPSMVVQCDANALATATSALDRGEGVVWAADAREGFHGGATYTRWVRSQDDAARALTEFAPVSERVRVMPFLEGIPGGIHAIVLPDGIATLRPVEMVTLREEGRGFRYCGVASYYDPPAADRDAMRAIARRAGEQLRDEVGFRGPLTVDGVVTSGGFLPTELNPRWGAGINVMAQSVPDVPVSLLLSAILDDHPLEVTADDIEDLIVPAADGARAGGAWTTLTTPITQTTKHPLANGGRVVVGPGAAGGFLRYEPDPTTTPKGPSIASRAAAAIMHVNDELELGLASLTPARDVRQA